MSGALIQLMANESFENTYDTTKNLTILCFLVFAALVVFWLYKI